MRVLATLLALAAAALAQAQESPESVYQKVHAATLAGNRAEMARHATADQRGEIAKAPEGVLKLMAAAFPKSYKVDSTQVGPDGKTAVLQASGMASLIGAPKMHYGTIRFAKEGAAWKVANIEWSDTKPGPIPVIGTAPARPAAAKPAAAKPAAAPADETDAAKAAAKQAAEEKAARAREEAARKQAELDERCKIKPVMTDAEIEHCRVASRR